MQAILTRVMPATNNLPTRIKATAARGSIVTAPLGSVMLSSEEAHRDAAQKLVARFIADDIKKYGPNAGTGWKHPFVSGCLPSGDWAHVFQQGGAL